MKLGKLYQRAIDIGIENDPRGRGAVEKELSQVNKDYQQLDKDKKKEFNMDLLVNPYADTRILNGDRDSEIKNVFVGVDMETPELLLAARLNDAGAKIDLVLSHHPQGYAYAGFYEVMRMQGDIIGNLGVPISVAEGLTLERMGQVGRRVSAANHMRPMDAARLLGLNFACIHTPADNCVTTYLNKLMEEKRPRAVGEIIEILNDIPEYKYAAQNKSGPTILLGDKKRKCGKIFVDMTGGTEGSKEMFSRLAAAGVSTIIAMHLSEEHFNSAKKENINVVIAGHISSDNLGLNLLLDSIIDKDSSLNIVSASGFKRIKR